MQPSSVPEELFPWWRLFRTHNFRMNISTPKSMNEAQSGNNHLRKSSSLRVSAVNLKQHSLLINYTIKQTYYTTL